ncbi:hypothetical protein EV385_6662 [Krasilnikovia cinnamomea]|uniref:Uncharacterized protein n=1 Tax=Krasilnikovia cinnamomea TaxID=349313 RepID=A0A4Q7Z7W4_9ACTN|nr:hypothetical protein [Krasilnikovia cinnamomea]RZU46587.1 hypothetical protein EV385_6662 [Krasilnikovia cinnamomea]
MPVPTRCGAALAAGVLAVLAAAGCATPDQTTTPGQAQSPPIVTSVPAQHSPAPATALQVHPRWESCAAELGGAGPDFSTVTRARLDSSFHPVSAILCTQQAETDSTGRKHITTHERHVDDIDALVAAQRLPDLPQTGDICTADAVMPPWIALVDGQGRWVHPAVPVTACDKPRVEVYTALDTVHTIATSSYTSVQPAPPAK